MSHHLHLILFIFLGIPIVLKAQIIKTETINRKQYSGKLNEWGFYVLRAKHDTVLNLPQTDFSDFKFKDFNGDGYKDIYLEWGGDIPERYSLYVLKPSTGKFIKVKEFSDFPLPLKIPGTT